jgi:hypothetical protein
MRFARFVEMEALVHPSESCDERKVSRVTKL